MTPESSRSAPPLRTLTFPLLGTKRRVRVFVPRGVEVEAPLLLLFDGQNVFDDLGSYAGGWYAHEAVEKMPSTVRRPIVVGIDNGGSLRNRELWPELGGFLAAICEHLLPTLRTRWSVSPGPAAIGGASMGGLAALAGHLRHPQIFGKVLATSPSLWVGEGALFHELPHHRPDLSARIYVDAGAKERGQMFTQAERMAALLIAHGYPRMNIRWRPDRRGTHHERHWRRRLPAALHFLFHKTGLFHRAGLTPKKDTSPR